MKMAKLKRQSKSLIKYFWSRKSIKNHKVCA
jgi:hypothetical protein